MLRDEFGLEHCTLRVEQTDEAALVIEPLGRRGTLAA
jgi:hypothetical protein